MGPNGSRFADAPAWVARLLLVLLLLLSLCGAALTLQPSAGNDRPVIDLTDGDLALYQAIAGRVGRGEDYYSAAVAEQRARGYPLRPVFTVRLPTLAWTIATFGPEGAALLLRLLMVAAIGLLVIRLRSLAGSRGAWMAAAALGAGSMALLTVPAMTYWHESWAALLIVLSIACRSPTRWLPSLFLGLLAVLFRELALPYLCVMAALAWRDGKRVEAVSWAAAILLFLGALTAHSILLSEHLRVADLASPGWSAMGGWSFVLAMVQRSGLFLVLPLPLVAFLVPMALLGWTSRTGAAAERIALLLLLYVAAFTVVGRPDNFYWGILIAPLLPMGLAFAPQALRDLIVSLRSINPVRSSVAG